MRPDGTRVKNASAIVSALPYIMPLGIVMDERICTGHEYALFWQTLRRYLKHPELTENGAEERAEMPEAVEA